MADEARPHAVDHPEAQPRTIQALQFDQAEFATPTGLTCRQCRQEITQSYYESAGQVWCETCCNRMRAPLQAGSGVKRFCGALVLGVLAAMAGAGLYFAITALTGYELGLVAIVVGLLVGSAVRWGSQRRGGWLYQGLAMFLTYSAIITTYIPPLLTGIHHALNDRQRQETVAIPSSVSNAVKTPKLDAPPPIQDTRAPSLLALAIGALFLYLLACATPFLGGLQNIMGLVIIGIGLYEAWKLNKRMPLQITGPYAVATAPVPPSAPQE